MDSGLGFKDSDSGFEDSGFKDSELKVSDSKERIQVVVLQ